MTLPTQPRNIDPERQALAPYNFVPLANKVVTVGLDDLPDQGVYHPDRHTGRIECILTTETPLYVRGPLTPKEFEQSESNAETKLSSWREKMRNKPDFFHTGDPNSPTIPGSSLRGMFRTLIEIAGYGKMTAVSNQQLVYRAVGDTTSHGERYRDRLMRDDGKKRYTPLMQAGYMEKSANGDWFIRPAQVINGTTFARINTRKHEKLFSSLKPWGQSENAYEIYVDVGPYQYQKVRGGFIHVRYARAMRAAARPGRGLVRAALAKSGWMPSKRSEAIVFAPDDQARGIPVGDELVEAYRNQQSQEQKKLLGKDGVLRAGQPVFYLVERGRLVFFGHCMMFRLPYLQSPLDFVPPQLRRESDVDLAEALFGYTKSRGEGKAGAYAGRVFISDATLEPGQTEIWLSDEPLAPKILASPKPTTFQHYLVQRTPNAVPTGGRFKDGRPRTEVRLDDYAGRPGEDTVIRGHKLYWHKGTVGAGDIRENKAIKENDKQHTQIQPVRPGVQFRLGLRFENLSEVELGALLWVLDKAADPAYRLKLGMGKPLGMGAIKLQSTLHLEHRDVRYQRLFDGDCWAGGREGGQAAWGQAVDAFEQFMVGQLSSRANARFNKFKRIYALLTMLSWPGPDPKATRYMEIERPEKRAKRGKRNEYDGRPVLPDPVVVNRKVKPQQRSAPLPTRSSGDTPPGYRRGVVKRFGLGTGRSFGFITPEGGGRDVFVHQSNLAPDVATLEEGQTVIFRIGQGPKGPRAEDVQVV